MPCKASLCNTYSPWARLKMMGKITTIMQSQILPIVPPRCLAVEGKFYASSISGDLTIGISSKEFLFNARMAELADALASGASGRKVVQVQVLLRALVLIVLFFNDPVDCGFET